jgi:hypothetical protein
MTTKSAADGDAALKLALPSALRKRIKGWIARHGEELTLSEAALQLIDQGLDWSDGLAAAQGSSPRRRRAQR